MQTGIVARVMDKGYGFIKAEGQNKDLFFHANEFDGEFNSLKEGDKVQFEVSEGQKGPQASKVSRA